MSPTFMEREVREIPLAAARLIDEGAGEAERFAQAFLRRQPKLMTTIGRGSSDHAAYFLKYAFEISLGIPVASLGPSLASLYGARLRLDDAASIAISQSGKSPDIVALAEAAGTAGALSVSIVNDISSPLATASAHVIDMAAGPETSVAATKSFVNSILAGLMVLSRIGKDSALSSAIAGLPDRLEEALSHDWRPLSDHLATRSSMFVLGRGPAIAIAHEAALKMKETCAVHGEAYSAAEVLHGPVEIVDEDFPVLVFNAGDRSGPATAEVAREIAASGGRVFMTGAAEPSVTPLGVSGTGHFLTDALVQIVTFYVFAEAHARRLGRNPDTPRHLKKVTETI